MTNPSSGARTSGDPASAYERFYLPYGRVAHAFSRMSTIGQRTNDAVCGASTWDNVEWRGTGSQDEYEKAATLPRCRNCELKIGTHW